MKDLILDNNMIVILVCGITDNRDTVLYTYSSQITSPSSSALVPIHLTLDPSQEGFGGFEQEVSTEEEGVGVRRGSREAGLLFPLAFPGHWPHISQFPAALLQD